MPAARYARPRYPGSTTDSPPLSSDVSSHYGSIGQARELYDRCVHSLSRIGANVCMSIRRQGFCKEGWQIRHEITHTVKIKSSGFAKRYGRISDKMEGSRNWIKPKGHS